MPLQIEKSKDIKFEATKSRANSQQMLARLPKVMLIYFLIVSALNGTTSQKSRSSENGKRGHINVHFVFTWYLSAGVKHYCAF